MGGVLVNRNQIGVDHRYAQAGIWKEQNIRLSSGQPADVAKADELKVNQMKLLRVNGRRLGAVKPGRQKSRSRPTG